MTTRPFTRRTVFVRTVERALDKTDRELARRGDRPIPKAVRRKLLNAAKRMKRFPFGHWYRDDCNGGGCGCVVGEAYGLTQDSTYLGAPTPVPNAARTAGNIIDLELGAGHRRGYDRGDVLEIRD